MVLNDAKVMITLPETGIFVTDQTEAASASIVLNTKPGYEFEQDQITCTLSFSFKKCTESYLQIISS